MIERHYRSWHHRSMAVLTTILAACAGEPSDAPAARGLPGAPVAIEAAPRLSVGVLQGDPMQELDRVVTPFLTPNGDLAVPTQGARTIRLFGPDREFIASYGGPGQGPGEFAYLRAAWARGDTIEAWDNGLQRMTRFLPGDSVQTIRLAGVPADNGLGVIGEGWALTAIGPITFGARDPMSVHTVSNGGALVARLADAPGMARYRWDGPNGLPGGSGPHPLTPTAIFAVHGDEIYAAESLTPTITVYDARGLRVRDIALPLEPPGPPATVLSAVIDSAVGRADADQRVSTGQRLSAFPEPELLSVLWDFIVDELGFLWVRPYDPFMHSLELGGRPGGFGGAGGRWLVLSADGAEVGWIDVPEGLEPAQITADDLVGIHRDELGVESVRVHGLSRR